jgi:hypothetical protein
MSPDTIRCCEIYRAAVAAGEDTTDVVGQLATWFDVQRPAIWKRLRRGGAVPLPDNTLVKGRHRKRIGAQTQGQICREAQSAAMRGTG